LTNPPDVTISIISADNRDLLLPCLNSLFENTDSATLEVYLVDNASQDSTAEAVAAAFPHVQVIVNETRLGFSSNNNLALSRGCGRYLMLLNDDTLIQPGAIDRLVHFMDAHTEAGAVGSFLLNPDGSFQPAFARFPSPIIEGLLPTGVWSHYLVQDRAEPFVVDSVCGAAMLVRREVVEQIGLLDTAFDPIYSEEVDWCYRIKQAGWKIYAIPDSQIIHYGSQTMNRVVPRKYELLLAHRLYYFRKHRGRPAAELYRAGLACSTSLKLLWWWTLGRLQKNHREKSSLHWFLLKRIPNL
jgi:GT2 family glycosyltransferase